MDELSRYAREPHDQITEINAALQYAVEEIKTRLQEIEVRIVQLEKYMPDFKKEQRDNASPADQPRRRGKEHIYRGGTR